MEVMFSFLQTIHPSEPLYSTYNTLTSFTKPTLLKGSEDVIIDYVAVDGTGSKNYMQKVDVQFLGLAWILLRSICKTLNREETSITESSQ